MGGIDTGRGASEADVDSARLPDQLGATTPAASSRRRSRPRPAVVLAVASLGVFMAFVDDTVVGIAFPNIVRSFPDATLSGLSWVLNAYNIAFAALMVPGGRYADVWGRRKMYVTGIIVFTLGSALSAAAPTLGVLIAARAVQGLGAAVIVPASLAIVLHGSRATRRQQAVTIWSATAALAAGIGPSIGGALVHIYNWRLVFLVNLPVGAAAWWLARHQLVESRAPGRRTSPDLRGAGLIALSVGALTLAIVQGPTWSWASAGVVAALAVAGVSGAAAVRRCRRHPVPVVDIELTRVPGFRVTGVLTFVGAAGFFSLGLANVLFMIEVWHYTPLQTGLAMTPAPFLAALAAGVGGRLALRIDARRLVVFGAIVWTAGPLVLLSRMGTRPDYLGAYLPAAALLAIGIGFAFPLVTDAAVSSAPRGRYASATALNGAIRQVGAAIGVAILAALLGAGARSGTLDAFRRGWVFAAACFGAVAVGSLALPAFRVPQLDDELELPRRRAAPTPGAIAARHRAQLDQRTFRTALGGESDETLLVRVPLFSTLDPAARRRLAEGCQTVRLEGGEWLFREGDPADAMYVVRSGRLEVLKERPGAAAELLDELGHGSVVGELGLLSAAGRSASVRGLRDAMLLRLDRSMFEEMLDGDLEFAASIARVLGAQLQKSRRINPTVNKLAATVAVVRSPGEGRAAALESELVSSLRTLTNVASLDLTRVQELLPGQEVGVALAQVLDAVEGEHELVILRAAETPHDGWLKSCLRQADRVLLVVDSETEAWLREPAARSLRGCDVALLAPPDRSDVVALLDALQPRSTQRVRNADDTARLARRLAGRAVGLVLSGGGARGFAHIGVIQELMAAGITIDRIGGASMGAFVGALMAQGMDAEEIDARCYWEFVRRNPLNDYRLPRTSLIRGARARAMCERALPGVIEDLPRNFFCVTTDIVSARLVVHRRGAVAAAVGASMCLPGLAPPVTIGRQLLVDGGVLDNLPVATMVAETEGPVIASDVTEPEQRTIGPDEPVPTPGLTDTLARVMLLGTADTAELGRRHANLYIAPDHEGVGRLEFHMLDEMREAGRRAALSALEHAPPSIFG